jgi:hypothetical protein
MPGAAAADRPFPASPPPEPIYDAEVVQLRLEDAGATLLALPSRGCLPAGYRTAWPEIVVDAAEAYGYGQLAQRPPVPTARRVTQMDEAFGWLKLLPADRITHRRILLLRALTSPITGRHRHTWRGIGEAFGWDYRAVQRWHAQGIGWIVQGLYAQQLGGADWARCWRAEREGPDSLMREAREAEAKPHPMLAKGMRTTRWG